MGPDADRHATAPAFRCLQGPFFRAVAADRVGATLDPPGPASAGRYHREGQPTLYLSPRADWATIAVSGYMREDGRPRVVVPVHVNEAFVLDQRDKEACRALGIRREESNANWRTAIAAGVEPPSWRNADVARAAGADGIVDRSRLIPRGWHLALFRWNGPGSPLVRVIGEPTAISLSSDGPHWGP